jgi:hypothetical protein
MIDVFARVSNAQLLDGQSDTTIVSDNALPQSNSASYLRDVGSGAPVSMRFYLDNVNNSTLTSIEFQVVLSSATSLASNVLLLATSGAVVSADITTGAYFDVLVPPVPPTLGDGLLRRYLGARYVIVGDVTITAVSAHLVVGSAGRVRKFVTGYTGP